MVFDASGSEVQLLTFQGGTLALFDASGAHTLGGGVRGAAADFASDGSGVLDVVFQDDSLFQFDGLGTRALGTIL